jgi:uncharacterized cupredoxin-like copper-binding protein
MIWKLLVPAGVVLAVVTAACGGAAEVGSGSTADPRVIEVSALDTLAYEPGTIEVGAGETVTFVVTNTGEVDHEFVVGDEEIQAMAEEEMSEGMHGHTESMAALAVEPGETKEATITFDAAGTLQYACHVEGHYRGGMVGTIEIT